MNEAAAAGEEVLARIAGGAMLYDASCVGHPDPRIFEAAHWQQVGTARWTVGGRGSIAFVTTPRGERWVLRHYRRGGFAARWLDDRYLWTGASRTRSFAEWRLLRRLRALGLPVPQPVAARYQRDGWAYRADLLTAELPTRETLAAALRAGPVPAHQWQAIGGCIRRLHEHGVHHADLNANNVLLGPGNAVFVLDFDRGRLRARGAWEQQVLARLRRSLMKITAGLPGDRFGEEQWSQLLLGLAV